MPRKTKHTFILKGVDTNAADIKFGFNLVSNIGVQTSTKDNQEQVTRISDLPSSRETVSKTYSYLDESNQSHECIVTMRDFQDSSKLPRQTDISCFWCRHKFEQCPIGVPVRYVPSKFTKIYYSEITKDKYQITDNIPKSRKPQLQELIDNQGSDFQVSDNYDEYFVVDGMFCSFNCALAFVKEHKHLPLYKTSRNLLHSMYSKVFNNPSPEIVAAPNWRLLYNYGGTLNIDDFRRSFETVEFADLDDFVYLMPESRMIGKLYEKRVKF